MHLNHEKWNKHSQSQRKLTFDQDGHVAVLSLKALLIKGAQDRGSKVRDFHMEQLGHVGHRGGGGR